MANYGRRIPGFVEGNQRGPMPGSIEERQAKEKAEQERKKQAAKDAAKTAKSAAKSDRKSMDANARTNTAMARGGTVSGRTAARLAKGKSQMGK
ncbi:hypothetical protein [Kribbella sp.]|uniref:hypothetical protein n=1 Tax=Kribbella sp. TaxID=1871183 RepID=UPI002D298495|nr:hypothetical protein [Kribbella sp.]HZX07753.1 hypothetical protein [Kribbella sp.]